MNIFRYFIFMGLMAFGNFVFALDYYWGHLSSPNTFNVSSPLEACNRTLDSTGNTSINSVFVLPHNNGEGFRKCSYKVGSNGPYEDVSVRRYGDSCPVDTEYDPVTGTCLSPPPPCEIGALFPAKGSTGPVVTSTAGINYVVSEPVDQCYEQCLYSGGSDSRPSSCYGTPGGDGWCNFVMKGTGENCTDESYTFAISGPSLNPPDTPNVPPSEPDPICPAGWTNSNGTCFKNPPKVCDPSTGEVCPPDGGDGGDGGDGEGGGGGGSGYDPNDPASGSDDDLDDALSGETDTSGEPCKPRADGTGCGGPVVANEECDKVMTCTGDAIQCAILRKQKSMACAYEYEAAKPFIEQQIAKDAYKLTTDEVDGSSLFSAGFNAPGWLPSGCPAPKAININGMSTSLSFGPACDFASALGPLFIALAGLFFAVYVGRAFGGS